jgi:protein tyrosine/serine phosphatase
VFKRFLKPEERYAKRMARIEQWDQPLRTRGQRLRAYADLMFKDHGFVRLAYLNLHKVTPQFWRSAQPAPHDIRTLAAKGLKTIVTLRGGRDHGAWPLEKEACETHAVMLREIVVRSREAPSKELLLSLPAFFESLATPALFHCKSGADRAGFMAAMAVLLIEKKTASEALKQLSWRYGHLKFAKTGILDAFLETYRDEGEAKGIPFLTWVEHHYDPQRLTQKFQTHFWSSLLVDRLFRRE